MWYRHRRGRWGMRGFPIPLFFLLFLIGGHSIGSFLIGIGIMIFVYLLLKALMSSTSQPGITGTPPMQSNQPYQQPYQPYSPYQQQGYSPYDAQPYQPYQQGYQPQQSSYESPAQAKGQEYEHPAYEQYEQPEAQYPQEELPPMEQ